MIPSLPAPFYGASRRQDNLPLSRHKTAGRPASQNSAPAGFKERNKKLEGKEQVPSPSGEGQGEVKKISSNLRNIIHEKSPLYRK